jgi:hypothetical protein
MSPSTGNSRAFAASSLQGRPPRASSDSQISRRINLLRAAAISLAILGAVFVIYQLWGYIAWINSDDFVATPPGFDPIADEVRSSLVRTQWIMVLWAVVWTVVLVLQWRSARRLTWPMLLTIAWVSVYWQDPLVNWTGYHFSYNAYLFNRGDWISHLPFVSHSGPMLTQPLLVEALAFYAVVPTVGVLAYGVMRFANRRLHVTSPVVLIVLAWATIFAFDAGLENLAIHQHMHAWTSVTEMLSLNAGTPQQWPIYEGVFLGVLWGLGGILMYFAGERRVTVLDDGIDTLVTASWGRSALTVLSVVGFYNLMFLAYNATLNLLASNVVHFPSWLAV